MAAYQTFVLSVLLIVCFCSLSEAIWCFQCNDTRCTDKYFDKTKVGSVNCQLAPPPQSVSSYSPSYSGVQSYTPTNKCSKIIKKVGNQEITLRNCFFQYQNEAEDKCMKRFGSGHEEYVKCEVCDKDNCNSAPGSYTVTMGLMFFTAALTCWSMF